MFSINIIDNPKNEYKAKQLFKFPLYDDSVRQKWEAILNRDISDKVNHITISRKCFQNNFQEIYAVYF